MSPGKSPEDEKKERLAILNALKASLGAGPQADNKSLVDLLRRKAELDREIHEKFFRERTFVDIDVQGSARLKDGQETQDVYAAFETYHSIVKTQVASNGGEIHSTAGDGVVAVFDIPNAAVRAAAAIQDQLAKFNQSDNRLKKPLQVRIGLNTGMVLIDPTNELGQIYDVNLDLAAHLQKEAGAGEILITENTCKLLDDRHLFELLRFWEAEQINIYKYKKSGAPKDAGPGIPPELLNDLPTLRYAPLIDPVAGVSARTFSPRSVVWVKQSDSTYMESRVRSVQHIGGGHYLLVVDVAGASSAWCTVESMLKLCTADDRAQTLAQQARGHKVRLVRLGEKYSAVGAMFDQKWIWMGLAVLAAFGVIAIFFKK